MTIVLLAMSLMFAGCASQVAYLKPHAPSEPTLETSQAFFIRGVGQEKEVNASEVCGGIHRVAKIESQLTPLDIILGVFTFGIYTPHTAKVYCDDH